MKSILNPVDLPKNFSANNTNNNLQLISFNKMEKQLGNKNENHSYNHNNTIKTTNERKNIQIAERCTAINLNSFTDIVQKATTIATTTTTLKHVGDDDIKDNKYNKQQKYLTHQQQNNNDNNMFVETATSDTASIRNCNSYDILVQQQQPSHQQHQQQDHIVLKDMDSTTLKTKRSRISSTPPLNGRDVELSLNTSSTCTPSTNSNNINPTHHNSTNTVRNSSSHLNRFELDI